jgi:hypothetical protein
VNLTGLQWVHVVLDKIDWSTGTLDVYMNGMRTWGAKPEEPARLGSAWTPGSGVRRIDVSGGIIDGIRMW